MFNDINFVHAKTLRFCVHEIHESFRKLPGSFQKVPGSFQKVPETFQKVPGSFQEVSMKLLDISFAANVKEVSLKLHPGWAVFCFAVVYFLSADQFDLLQTRR